LMFHIAPRNTTRFKYSARLRYLLKSKGYDNVVIVTWLDVLGGAAGTIEGPSKAENRGTGEDPGSLPPT